MPQINTATQSFVSEVLKTALMVGEERTLTPGEIASINDALRRMHQDSLILDNLFSEAQKRFKEEMASPRK